MVLFSKKITGIFLFSHLNYLRSQSMYGIPFGQKTNFWVSQNTKYIFNWNFIDSKYIYEPQQTKYIFNWIFLI